MIQGTRKRGRELHDVHAVNCIVTFKIESQEAAAYSQEGMITAMSEIEGRGKFAFSNTAGRFTFLCSLLRISYLEDIGQKTRA